MAIIRVYLSSETQKVIVDDVEDYIKRYSNEYTVEEALIRAVCKQESKFSPFAIRYEPHLKRAIWYKRLLPEEYREDRYAYCSMGYMQVLYGIARSYGFKGTPHDLLSAENSIKFGVRHLAELIERYYYIDKVISAYNQGTPRKDKATGKFKNHNYVRAVAKNYKAFGGRVSIP